MARRELRRLSQCYPDDRDSGPTTVLANKVLNAINGLLSIVTIPFQLVTTLVLGFLVTITFGLLLLPISLVWMLFLGALLPLSWASARFPGGRVIIGFLGLPIALLGAVYVQLMPSMGELESRGAKLLLCETWPFSLEFWRFWNRKSVESTSTFETVLVKVVGIDPLRRRVVERLKAGEELDASV